MPGDPGWNQSGPRSVFNGMSDANDGDNHDASNDYAWMLEQQIPVLRRFARSLEFDADRADDLVQDCLERALRKRRLWRRHGNLRGWLLRMLYRVHVDTLRKQRDGMPLEAVAEPASGEATQAMQVELDEVVARLTQLPADQRAALELAAVEGLQYDEIAHILNIPLGTVRSRLSRARAMLRDTESERARQGPRLRRVR